MGERDEQARLIVEDLADLLSLARCRASDRALQATIRRMSLRHDQGPRPSAVKLACAAELLGVSVPTVRSWMAHGVLRAVPGEKVTRISATSLAEVLAVVRETEQGEPGRRRLARVVDALRDRDLLERAQDAAQMTGDLVEYGEDDLKKLLGP
ncbi:helix-turn-helix domain-containing protein [Streptosporangium sp. NPDC002524]|uniref:helix-turn-helix domain-containing protein n=1 Tax=Streptosporangium sp. NPDC002524 TaxID=3154537 RepID=UPI00332840BC